MGAQFTSKTVVWSNDTETILITRDVPNPGGTSSTITTIYNGPGDFQDEKGSQYINAQGVVDQADAIVYLEPQNGTLIAVQVGDEVAVNGAAFNVVLVAQYSFQPAHTEIQLKRGPLDYKK